MIEEVKEILESQNKLFRKAVAELNGKVMDYESCRLLEDFFKEHNENMINSFEKAIEKLRFPGI